MNPTRLKYSAKAASKAAVIGDNGEDTRLLAKELKRTGITANCVALGSVVTEMFFDGKTEEMVKKLAASSKSATSCSFIVWIVHGWRCHCCLECSCASLGSTAGAATTAARTSAGATTAV
ncbi:hypothetical protein QYF36_019246 [Acer negundo]|nr:hypothetical protein QYF36_019246 [Acer negundo]